MATTEATLNISVEKVCFVALKAREFDVKDLPTVPDDASNATDDGMASVLEDRPDDPVAQELVGFINALSVDERMDLVALAWIGRGDGTLEDWDQLREQAAEAHGSRTARYLLGLPLLPDFLEEG